MIEMLSYSFMQRAFLVAVLIAVISPCIGVVIILKRLSNIGDAASHSALAGIACGLAFGFNPVLGAVLFSTAAVFSIEGLRRFFSRYAEIATTVVLSAGVGLTAVFSDRITSSSANLNSFLFGSIVAVSDLELILTVILSIAAAVVSFLLYKELFYITFDEESAGIAGVPVRGINFVFMLLVAVTVSVASRTVGTLMISSLIVLPAACAMVIAKSYRSMFALAIGFAEFFTVAGLTLSYFLDLRPGGTIILLGVVTLVAILIIRRRSQ